MKRRVNTLLSRACKQRHARADHQQTTHVRGNSALDPHRLVLATEGSGTERWARTICFFIHPSANIYLATSWHVWGTASSQNWNSTMMFKILQTSGFIIILILLISKIPVTGAVVAKQKQLVSLVVHQENIDKNSFVKIGGVILEQFERPIGDSRDWMKSGVIL